MHEAVITAIPEDPYENINEHKEPEQVPVSSCSTESTQRTSECEGLVESMLSTSPTEMSALPVVETFMLSSIILSAFSASSILGAHVFSSSIHAYFSPLGAVFTAIVVIPLLTWSQLSERNTESLHLLIFSGLCQGILVGAALSRFAIFSEPLVIPSLLSTALVLFVSSFSSRSALLTTTSATSLLFHFTLGSSLDSLTPIYSLLSCLYTLVMMVPIQMNANDRDAMRASDRHAVIHVALLIGIRCLVYGMFGVSVE